MSHNLGLLAVLVDLFVIYAFSFVTGIGLYRLVTPKFLRQPSFAALFIPGLGLLQLTIVSAYLIYLSVPIVESLYVSLAIGAIALVASAFQGRGVPRVSIASRARDLLAVPLRAWLSVSVKIVLFGLLLGVVMAPVIHAGIPTTPYRVGIDQVGYAETAQYLLEGGTLNKIRATLLAQLGTTDIAKAKAQNVRDLNFGTYVDSEFLLKATRWGFPGAVAALTFLTGSVHVYRIEFVLVILTYALTLALVFRILRDYFLMPSEIAFSVMAVVALNCNLLNVYYEGQLTQPFMMPFFTMALALYLRSRSLPRDTGNAAHRWLRFASSLPLFALLVAGMFAAYNEIVVLLLGFAVVTSLLDLVFYRQIRVRPLIYVGLGFVGGFLAVWPFSNQWLVYTFANLSGLSTAGFWQPHWASFAEILGFLDMYHMPGYLLRARSVLNETVSVTLSLVLVTIFTSFVRRVRGIDVSFWTAPAVIILVAYLKMHYMDRILNYPYMKIYTMLTPLVVCTMFAALYWLAQDEAAFADLKEATRRRVQSFARAVQYAAFVAVAVTGVLYIHQYVSQEGYVNADMFSMYKYSNGHRQFDQYALFVPRRAPSIADFMLTPLISMNLVNENDGEKVIADYLNAPVAVLFENQDLACRDCLIRRLHHRIAYANDSYILLDTGMKLKDICAKEAASYTLDTLPIDNKSDWPGLPAPQCDYTVGRNYLSYGR